VDNLLSSLGRLHLRCSQYIGSFSVSQGFKCKNSRVLDAGNDLIDIGVFLSSAALQKMKAFQVDEPFWGKQLSAKVA
jgi:hypothetical protein